MSDAKKTKAQLIEEIAILQRRVRQLETRLQIRALDGGSTATALRNSSQYAAAEPPPPRAVPSGAITGRLLCIVSRDIREPVREVLTGAGHRLRVVSTMKDLERVKGHFDLALVDGRPDYSPFRLHLCTPLVLGQRPGLTVDRAMLIDYAGEEWGLPNAYACHCSNYCRLKRTATAAIDEASCRALAAAVAETLALPPYEVVNYYDYVSDAMLHTIVESSQAPMLILDTERRIYYANLVAQAWFKRPTHLLKGLPFTDFIASPEHAPLFESFLEHIQTMLGGAIELPLQSRDGARFDALVDVYRLFSPEFPPDSIGMTLHDITERKRAEQALQQSEEQERRFQLRLTNLAKVCTELSLVDNGRDLCRLAVELGRRDLGFSRLGLWLLDEDPDYLRGSFGTDEEGRTRDEHDWRIPLYKDRLDSLVHLQPGAIRVEHDIPLYDHAGRPVGHGDRAMTTIWDGTQVLGFLITDNYMAGQPLSEQDGEMLCLYASSIGSLYSRCKAETELRRWEEQTRALLRGLNGFLWTASVIPGSPWKMQIPSGESFSRLTGYEPHQLRSREMQTFLNAIVLPEDVRKKDEFGERALRGEIDDYYQEYRIRHANGSIRWIAESVRVSDRSGRETRVMGICLDITERKHLEEQLIQAQKMEAIGQLAGGVAHDFNNILTGIMGNIALAQFEKDRATSHLLLQEAEKASARAASLVKQLLAFGRKTQIVRKPVDLHDVISEVEAMVRKTFDRRIEIAVSCPPVVRPVLADASQMHQVILNLLVNARDALETRREWNANPPRIEVAAENVNISEREAEADVEFHPGRYVLLTVRDNGAGMREETRSRIFEPFFTTKELGKGTGLGLATVYGIVRQHGGWITVESAEGAGATFRVYLPMAQDDVSRVSTAGQAPSPTGSECVLVVEDEQVVRNLARSILERLGYQVLTASDGREGLEVYLRHRDRIELCLLDISMPFLSGIELMKAIREEDPDAPVLFSSGYAPDTEADRKVLDAASGFVSKPYRLQELAQAVRQALDDAPDRTAGPMS